ncbi:odorant receptor 131-2-like [Sparus aurata]|uniref:odorant receptor 131-2-like n=1 Tax=Sparus aurata TaxID=8175 RepID=UPI0011C1768F|nr:odorant receptor 131-2-like [Sparus aurata]
MAANNSLNGGNSSLKIISGRVIFVQVLVFVFLCINSLLIMTFFMKDYFYSTMRYILFAMTILSDCLYLLLTDILLILSYFGFIIQMWFCLVIYMILFLYTYLKPVTLTAMTLERCVAICLPLRHSVLCSTRSCMHCILFIHIISCLPCIAVLSIFFTSSTHGFYIQKNVCFSEMFIFHKWQGHLPSAINQFYFLVMVSIIVICYVQIIKVAKAASGENKKSTWSTLQTNFLLYINVRYFNYITFILAPRCLSPLIYGLRDEMFFHALKYHALCGLYKKTFGFLK